jgi:N-acetylmuramoyl-L-alanine amidase
MEFMVHRLTRSALVRSLGGISLAVMAAVGALSLAATAQPANPPAPIPSPVTAARVSAASPAPSPAAALPVNDPIAAILAGQAPAATTQAAPLVLGMRLGEHPDKSRLVVELSDPVDVKAFTLAAPDRVVIDMPEVLWRVVDTARPNGTGTVKSYRYGLFRKGNSRFVIDVNKPVRVDTPRIYPPENGFGFRLVIDLYPTTAADFIANAGWPKEDRFAAPPAVVAALPPSAPLAAPGANLPGLPPQAGKRTIIIDPGHGGIDPGTHGATGLKEKDIVLGVSKKLRDSLKATGRYQVHLTRDSDIFIPLRERVNIARAAKGDLFMSLHIDANDHREVRGASIYTLSEDASDREAAKLAEKENMSDVIAGVDLTGDNSPVRSILIDLAQRDTMNRSVRFAETVLTQLPTATFVRPTTPHRSAGFAVLKGPDIPAVLVELGYLSNSQDEAIMATDAWRARVAKALHAAIDKHFQSTVPLARQAGTP